MSKETITAFANTNQGQAFPLNNHEAENICSQEAGVQPNQADESNIEKNGNALLYMVSGATVSVILGKLAESALDTTITNIDCFVSTLVFVGLLVAPGILMERARNNNRNQ